MIKKLIFLLCITLIVTGCTQKKRAKDEILVGTIAGPETTLMEVAKQVAHDKYHLNLKIVTFNDYVLPNRALADGSIDANVIQHAPYLQASIKAQGYQLIGIGKTFIYPMGIYSHKVKHLRDLKRNAIVAIPNDPSNQARALLLLERAGLLTLRKGAGVSASLQDITRNPLKLNIKEMDAAQLPRILPDVSLALINTNYAMVAGLLPTRDALFIEHSKSPYANIVVIRKKDRMFNKFKDLVDSLHSNAVLQKAKELFKGQAIPAW